MPLLDHSSERHFLAMALSIICLATVIRFTALGANEFWLDEAFTGLVAFSSDWLELIYQENSPPVYYLVTRAWAGLFGSSEFAIRSLSALTGVGFVAASIATGRELFNRIAGLWAGLFAAVAPLAVYYSQEARNYSLLLFLIMAMVYLMARVGDRGAGASWLALIVVTVLIFHTHYFGVIIVASTLLGWSLSAVVQRDNTGLVTLYSATTIAALAFVPWLVWAFVLTPNTVNDLGWIERGWGIVPLAWKIPTSLQVLTLGPQPDQVPIKLRSLSATAIPAAIHLGATLALAVTILMAILPSSAPLQVRRNSIVVLSMLLVPLVALLGISLAWRPVYVIGRYDILALPALVLLAGYGLSRLASTGKRLRLTATIVVALILLGAMSLATWRYLDHQPLRSIETLATKLKQRIVDRSGLILSGPVAALAVYYLHRQGIDRDGSVCHDIQARRLFRCRFYPQDLELAPGSQERYIAINTSSTSANLAYLDDMLASIDTLWVVSHGATLNNYKFTVDRAEYQLFNYIYDAGFSIRQFDPESNIVHLDRR